MFSVLSHLFVPSYSNNQKAKVLHSFSIFLFISSLIVYQLILQTIPLSGIRILGYASEISVSEVIALSNQKRHDNGLPGLTENSLLNQAAYAKGQDMLAKDYWAHVSPEGIQPWKFFTDSGYTYRYAGENLARDFSNAGSTVEAWMASTSHRDNLLSNKYQEIGVAVVEGDLNGVDTTIIVQLFGTKYAQTTPTTIVEEQPGPEQIAVSNVLPTVVPTLVTTAVPTSQPQPSQAIVPAEIADLTPTPLTSGQPLAAAQEAGSSAVLISPFNTTREVSVLMVAFLLAVLVIDGIIIKNRKVVRIGGRTFAHLAFLGMVLAIALIAKAGSIL